MFLLRVHTSYTLRTNKALHGLYMHRDTQKEQINSNKSQLKFFLSSKENSAGLVLCGLWIGCSKCLPNIDFRIYIRYTILSSGKLYNAFIQLSSHTQNTLSLFLLLYFFCIKLYQMINFINFYII